jgi:hypothetical protein
MNLILRDFLEVPNRTNNILVAKHVHLAYTNNSFQKFRLLYDSQ